MTQEEFDEIATYTRELPTKRAILPDKQLLDDCQAFLDAFVANALEHGFEAPPAPVAPTNVTVPYLAGTGEVGSGLACTMGIWEGEPTGYSYKWLRDEDQVGGSTDTYVVVDEDRGHSLTCLVTASNELGNATAPPSNAVAVPA